MTSDPAPHDLLRRYEVALASRDPLGLDGSLMDLVTDDFLEFGRSGRTWTRESIRPLLEGSASSPVAIEDFQISDLAPGVALVTYRALGAKRSSIWVHREGRWQIRFHQGTPVDGNEPG